MLRAARWRQTARRQRGTIVLMQGRSESIEKYFETISDLRRRGFAVLAFDWRGQGGSERLLNQPRKGHVDDFADYVTDLSAVLDYAGAHCPQPWFGLAHSMGAMIALLALEAGERRLQRLVLASPLVALASLATPGLARLAAAAFDFVGLGGSYIPGGGATSISTRPFESNILTSDAARYARQSAIVVEAPELAIGDPTIGWTLAMFRAMERMNDPRFGTAFVVPSLMVVSGDDRLVSSDASLGLAARIRACKGFSIPGARHELLSESDLFRDQFFALFDAFIPGEAAPA